MCLPTNEVPAAQVFHVADMQSCLSVPACYARQQDPVQMGELTAKDIRVAARRIPQAWRRHVRDARHVIVWSLQTLSATALHLATLWHVAGFETRYKVQANLDPPEEQDPETNVVGEAGVCSGLAGLHICHKQSYVPCLG